MAKLTNAQKKWLQTHVGKKHGEKKYGYTWDARQKRWEKGKYSITPKIPKPSPITIPVLPSPVVPVKTNHPLSPAGVVGAGAANFTYVTQAEMQREFAGMVATELWQYTNAEAVDGIFNNVKLMLELTEVRRGYDPNDIITSATPFIKSVRRTTNNKLVIEIDGTVFGRHMLLEFFIGNTDTFLTGDYT
jgi:hypothetical protein